MTDRNCAFNCGNREEKNKQGVKITYCHAFGQYLSAHYNSNNTDQPFAQYYWASGDNGCPRWRPD